MTATIAQRTKNGVMALVATAALLLPVPTFDPGHFCCKTLAEALVEPLVQFGGVVDTCCKK